MTDKLSDLVDSTVYGQTPSPTSGEAELPDFDVPAEGLPLPPLSEQARISIQRWAEGLPKPPTPVDVLMEILAELRVLRMLLPTGVTGVPPERGVSSVEIKSSTRGVDVSVKSYVGSPVSQIADIALEEYFRVLAEAQRRISEGAK